jgi:spore maturation protein CgeB
MAPSLFDLNLRALESRSPMTAAVVRQRARDEDSDIEIRVAADGSPILQYGGRALDSRREPRKAAERQAQGVECSTAIVAGFGAGYLVEALLDRGIAVAAILEPDARVLAAAMRARDLTRVFSVVPVWLLGSLDKVRIATLRLESERIVAHAPSVQGSGELASLVDAWPKLPVAKRAPRVLVAGPIYGGSLEIARATARAVSFTSADVRMFDFSVFGGGFQELGGLSIPSAARRGLQSDYADLLGRALVEVAREWRPDLVIALAQAPLDAASLDSLKGMGIVSAFWFVENHRVLTYWKTLGRHYDWFYGIQRGRFLEQLAAEGVRRPHYLPMACDPAVHRPLPLTGDERATFGSAVSFAGAPYLNRRRLLVSLADLDLRIWGDGWNEPALAHFVAGGGRRFDVETMVRIFNATEVNLNLHSAAHVADLDPDPDFVNPRTFEIAACGAFQLTDWREPLGELFDEGEMVTFRSAAELRQQIAHYLSRPEERRAIAERARARAIAEHTYEHRVRRILADALPPHLAAAAFHGIDSETLDLALLRLEHDTTTMDEDEALMRIVFEVEKNWGLR